jgi:hypothetical protein
MHYTQTVQPDCTPDVLHAGTRGPTAVPYTHGPSEQCPATYTTDYRGGTSVQSPADLQVDGLSSNYIVRCVYDAFTMCFVSDAALKAAAAAPRRLTAASQTLTKQLAANNLPCGRLLCQYA